MDRKSKVKDTLEELLYRDGWWKCKYCSVKNWDIDHRPEEKECPNTHKPRTEAEDKVD